MSLFQQPVVILGAGPTGLGAAWALHTAGCPSWELLEGSDHAGGLASSILDAQGFTWDLGGHVLFSHYEYFDRLMDDLLGDAWIEHERESWIWMRHRFIPYPLQNNIRHLPLREFWRCLLGLWRRTDHPSGPDFRAWLLAHFGPGLYESFLGPYNRKVWARDLSALCSDWVGERVSRASVGRILSNVLLRRDDRSWGPNATFRFPRRGGTGAIWQALSERLPKEKMRFGRKVKRIHTRDRFIECETGERYRYDRLLSSIPLDQLLRRLEDRPDLAAEAEPFRHSSTHVVGIGLEGQPPDSLKKKCWVYFPEESSPFYRMTVFSNYSPYNVPRPGQQWSLMAETSESPEKAVDGSSIVHETLAALKRFSFIPPDSRIQSVFHHRLEYGYPTPFLGRDRLLVSLDAELRSMGIWSRGRFGGWKYEISNQDHSLMQGVETIAHWMNGAAESTYSTPHRVNAGVNRPPYCPPSFRRSTITSSS